MAERLLVYFDRRLVGAADAGPDGRLTFAYDEAWLGDGEAFAISQSLPLRAGRVRSTAAQAFFANLLPEGAVREAVARQLGLSADNDVALLAALGGDCAGALTILPDPLTPQELPAEWEPLPDAAIAEMARRYSVLATLTGRRAVRLSLAGAQDKLPVRRDETGGLHLPLNGAPSTHILKVPSRDFKHLPANEVLLTHLARAAGLSTVDIELRVVEDVPVALVRRYDRVVQGDDVTRLHQEDLCQALGLPPRTKYETEGGPSFADAMRLVRAASDEPLPDAAQLLRWLVFVVLAGDADGHGNPKRSSRESGGPNTKEFARFCARHCSGREAELKDRQ